MTIIYSQKPLKSRPLHDVYITPLGLCKAVLGTFLNKYPNNYNSILDPGAGEGNWGRAVREVFPFQTHVEGNDIRDLEKPLWYNRYITGNYLEIEYDRKFDLIIGNPPYNCAEKFIDKSLSLLMPNGFLIFLLRLSFLESKKRYKKYYSTNLRPIEVLVSVRRISFTGDGATDNTTFAIYVWRKNHNTEYTKLDWLDWNYE